MTKMTIDQDKIQFYQQFDTVVHNHQEWLKTPDGLLAVVKHPWKGQAPIVRVDYPDNDNLSLSGLREIIARIQARHK